MLASIVMVVVGEENSIPCDRCSLFSHYLSDRAKSLLTRIGWHNPVVTWFYHRLRYY